MDRNGKRMLDREKALALWDRNTKRNGSERVSNEARQRDQRGLGAELGEAPAVTTAEVAGVTPEALKTLIMGLPEDQIPGIDTSRERKAHYDAEVARLEALKERGEVGSLRDMEGALFERARAVRDALLGLADRLAPMLAATTDARECHRLLTEEHRIALRGLADV